VALRGRIDLAAMIKKYRCWRKSVAKSDAFLVNDKGVDMECDFVKKSLL